MVLDFSKSIVCNWVWDTNNRYSYHTFFCVLVHMFYLCVLGIPLCREGTILDWTTELPFFFLFFNLGN